MGGNKNYVVYVLQDNPYLCIEIHQQRKFMNLIRTHAPLFVLCLYVCSTLCGTGCSSAPSPGPAVDPHSYAMPERARVTHLSLDLKLDFEKSIMEGVATLQLEKQEGVQQLRLDTKDLTIQAVKISDEGGNFTETEYLLQAPDSILGSALLVELEPQTQFVEIRYETSPEAEALQWLPPRLTASKRAPFLLTQSQAINARTWVPIQDSPGIRFTYDARVQVPPGLMAVMSADNPTEVAEDGVYTFAMDQPIPAYLLALAVGELAFEPIGERTGVYAEPTVIQRATYELAEMEEMMQIAEELYGPYRWERYDVIILPASFPFGGMENPRLTFATPTILAGDRSLVSLIAHELAHSWSGNLVTNATWNDFWLNEGFTVYFENRIMEALKGRKYSEMLAELSYQDLAAEVIDLGPNSPRTHLKLDLKGEHPDDGMNAIAYDKGYYFLRLLEERMGRETFDAFLRSYFDRHAFETMTTEAFVEELRTQLFKENPSLMDSLQVRAWVYGPGVPPNVPVAEAERFDQVEEVLTSSKAGEAPANLATEGWSTHEWLHFIRHLPDSSSADLLENLDKAFDFTHSTNAEIQAAWYLKAVRNGYEPAYGAMRDFLVQVGRRKFLTPLYRALMATEDGKKLALDIYEEARPNYHPISANSVDEIVGWEAG